MGYSIYKSKIAYCLQCDGLVMSGGVQLKNSGDGVYFLQKCSGIRVYFLKEVLGMCRFAINNKFIIVLQGNTYL